MKRKLIFLLIFPLSACRPQAGQPSAAEFSPSPLPSETASATPGPTRTPVPTHALRPTPFWGPAAWACYASTCAPPGNEPITWEVKPGEIVRGGSSDTGYVVFAYGLNRPAPPLRQSSFQADLLVENTSYAESYFNVVLDLHGTGTIRSWYAQVGYIYDASKLGVFCQAFSYNSNTPRYYYDAPYSPGYDTWHTFKIEVIPTDAGWHYAFRYWYDGTQLCSYQPPDLWDGNDRYKVLWQAASIYPEKGINSSEVPLRAQVRNAYLYVLDSPGADQ